MEKKFYTIIPRVKSQQPLSKKAKG